MGMFKMLHPENLNQLRALLSVKTPVWFHADGNMYIVEKESVDRSKFTNYNPDSSNHPANVGARYRYKFTDASQVPTTLDQMERMFLEQKQSEDAVAAEPTMRESNFVFTVPKAEAPAAGTDTTGDTKPKTNTGKGKSPAAAKAAELAAATGSEPVDGGTGTTGEPTT